jgi:hypothetical protein
MSDHRVSVEGLGGSLPLPFASLYRRGEHQTADGFGVCGVAKGGGNHQYQVVVPPPFPLPP